MTGTKTPTSATSTPSAKQQWLAANLKPGEAYAGLILGLEGEHDYHLILLSGEVEGVTRAGAKEFAVKLGGELPTRREQALLFANLQREFQPRAYWSSEQRDAGDDYAWYQFFDDGYQNVSRKSASLRARPVRRLPIE